MGNEAAMQRSAVVITGASSGIGAATAELLAREAFVAFAGVRNDADGARLAALHENIRPVRLDVTDRESIDVAARAVSSSGLPLLGVVNNAGIAIAGPLEFLSIDELRTQFEVNVFGALAVTQALLPQLRAQRGRIVFVGSISGRVAVPFIGPYSASKFALRALGDALRMELAGSGIAVSLVEPGSVQTPIWQKGRSREEFERRFPSQAMTYYRYAMDALMRVAEHEERTGMPAERVSRAILHALTARRPHARYLLGTPARLGNILALLPARIHDRLMLASMHLSP